MADEQISIQPERIQDLNDKPLQGGDYVLYWMQQAQRAEYNHALEHTARRANALGKPLLVPFGLMDDYPEANLRHYHFMLGGLQDVEQALTRRGVKFIVQRGAPDGVAQNLAQNAALLPSRRPCT